jgi:hypothetical protein
MEMKQKTDTSQKGNMVVPRARMELFTEATALALAAEDGADLIPAMLLVDVLFIAILISSFMTA